MVYIESEDVDVETLPLSNVFNTNANLADQKECVYFEYLIKNN
ncbi:MAG: hypothetical protein O9264_11950 [Leptospira sp.]|nr:hypothetical protein [Leptospira sp.]